MEEFKIGDKVWAEVYERSIWGGSHSTVKAKVVGVVGDSYFIVKVSTSWFTSQALKVARGDLSPR